MEDTIEYGVISDFKEEEKSVSKGINLFWDIFHKSPQSNKTLLDVKDQIKELNKMFCGWKFVLANSWRGRGGSEETC